MIIMTIRTDKPEAEVGLYDDETVLAHRIWFAHRQLAETLHTTMKELLNSTGRDWQDVDGLVVFQGPGSFTGLRIGFTVANTLASSLDIPIVATRGLRWAESGVERLASGENHRTALPYYGTPVHITPQKK